MKTYKLTGTYRKAGAIGKMENFVKAVEAENPAQAMEKNRIELYTEGYDNILHMFVEVKTGKNTWKNIPMLKALGLE